jgi:hypothetical protein
MIVRHPARALLCLVALLAAAPAMAQKPLLRGQLAIPEFSALADKASESVNVTLDANLLGMACRWLSTADPEQAKAKKLCSSLRGIWVRHYTFESDYAYPRADIEGVRRQLNAPGWSQIVGASSRKENTKVDVYVLIDQDKAQGLSIIASQPREFTIVNIVGSIDLDQLHELEGQLGVPDLDIETRDKPPARPPPERR